MLPQKKYTYEDYYNLDDGVRYEVYYGEIHTLPLAYPTKHQEVLGCLLSQFLNKIKSKKDITVISTIDVRFNDFDDNGSILDSVVQPDIVIADKKIIDKRGCVGAPDLIVEIISPGTAKRDTETKFEIYQRYGVKEYWIVNPNDQNILVFLLGNDGEYGKPKIYAREDKIQVSIFQDLTIDLSEVFEIEEEETNPNEIRI